MTSDNSFKPVPPGGKPTIKAYLLPLVGILLGGMAAFWIFAVLFSTPVAKIFPEAALPLGLAAAASFALARMEPGKWKLLAGSVALPTVLLAALLLIALWTEGRGDWGWAVVAGAVLAVCMASGWLARVKNQRV